MFLFSSRSSLNRHVFRRLLVLPIWFHSCRIAAMSTHTTERDGSGTVTVSPRNEASQSALMVICHGLGDSAEGFADVAEVSERERQGVMLLVLSPHCFRREDSIFLLFPVSLSAATCVANAIRQIYSTNGSNKAGDDEYGYAYAFLVRYQRFG